MKKTLYVVLAVYLILHIAVFTYYPAMKQPSQTVLMFDAAQWLVPMLCFVFLIPKFERVPIRILTYLGLAFTVLCAVLAGLKVPGIWWAWSTLGFIMIVALVVLNETKLLSLSLAVVFLGFGSWEIIYQLGLWFYHSFYGGDLGNLTAVLAENLTWIIASVIIIAVLQRRYKIFRPGTVAYVLFGISIICTAVWFATGMDIPLLWWKGVGPWTNPAARPLFIMISRGSQAFWMLGTAALFVNVRRKQLA